MSRLDRPIQRKMWAIPLPAGLMLAAGYALAGSSYATTGWAVHEAIPDQMAVLDVFQSLVGTPTHTIAWGHSLGGMITAGLLSLDADLAALDGAARIPSDPGALTYLSDNVTYNGQLTIPVLTMHTTGNGLVPVEDERGYSKVVHEANDGALLRETFVHRAGHCEFTPAETITAVQTLELRLATGKWKDLTVADLNGEAAALGPEFNVIEVNGSLVETPPQFLKFEPRQFLRIFDAFTQ
jgi:hypothetical protein